MPEKPYLTIDRRSFADRRARLSSMLGTFRPRGRRRAYRRRGEGRGSYVDRPLPEVLVMVCFILTASALDALLTLLHLEAGAIEVNPLMQLAIDRGPAFFVGLKMGITGLGVLCLSTHQLFPLGILGLRCLSVAYSLLLLYHGYLLASW